MDHIWFMAAHLLVPLSFGLMSMAIDGLVVIGLLLVSCASWIAGIWSDRKSLRMIGAIDLLFSWVIAALTIIRGVESHAAIDAYCDRSFAGFCHLDDSKTSGSNGRLTQFGHLFSEFLFYFFHGRQKYFMATMFT